VIALLALMAMLQAMPTTIDKGSQSRVDDRRQVVVRTDAEWARLWTQHNPDRPRPAVDFSKQMVVGVFMGSRNTAGFSVEILSATDENGVLTVRYRETVPAKGAITAQVITSPYQLVTVPRTEATVKFEKTDQ
jgi:PrcB C-terminal